MKPEFTKKPEFMRLAAAQKKTELPLLRELMRFLLVMLIGLVASAILMTAPELLWLARTGRLYTVFGATLTGSDQLQTALYTLIEEVPDWMIAVIGMSSVALGIAAVVYCRGFEKRSLASMGLVRRHALRHFGLGILLGAGLYAAVAGLGLLFRGVRIDGLHFDPSMLPLLGLFLLSYLLQGVGEGLLLHGYLAASLSTRLRLAVCIVLASLLYATLRSTGLGPFGVSFFNLVLFGLLLGLVMLKTGDLWGIFGLRMAWGFVMTNVFSFTESGSALSFGLLRGTVTGHNELLTGGDAGLEGSLCTTFVLLAAVGALVWLLRKNPPEPEPEQEPPENA